MQETNTQFGARDEKVLICSCQLASFLAGQFLASLLVARLLRGSSLSFGRLFLVFLVLFLLGLLFGFIIHFVVSAVSSVLEINEKSNWLYVVGIVLLVSAAVYFYPVLFPGQVDADEPYHAVLQVVNSSEQYEGLIFASMESDKYHDASCQYVKNINMGNLICFDSPEVAEDYAYTPCPICFPRKDEHTVNQGNPSLSSPSSTPPNSKPSLSEIYRNTRDE